MAAMRKRLLPRRSAPIGECGMGTIAKFSTWSALRRQLGPAIIILLSPMLLACGVDRGETAPRSHELRPTFVSLNPCLDSILVEVAAPGQILALSHYSRDPVSRSISPEDAERWPLIGGTAEEVIALEPDIVLASTFIAPATRTALERAGLRVETFDSPTTIAQSVVQVRRIANLSGSEDAGAALVERMRDAGRPVRAGDDPPTAVLWQPGQIVPGERTLVSELLRERGFASYAQGRGLKQADHVSLESLLADPPDILLVAGDSRGQRHSLLGALEGMRVEGYPQNLLYCGGPTIPIARARLSTIMSGWERERP